MADADRDRRGEYGEHGGVADADHDERADSGVGVWLDENSARVSHDVPDQPDAEIASDLATLLHAFGDPARLSSIPKRRTTITGSSEGVVQLVAAVSAL